MSLAREGVEALVRDHNTAELTEGRMLRKITRDISPWVSDFELRVLLFIFDRTYTFGKASEVIPIDHFLNGVRLGTGEILHPRINASKRSVYRALQNLIDNVIILRGKKHKTATPSYAINPVWTPDLCQHRHKLVPQVAQVGAGSGTSNINNRYVTHEGEQVAPAQARVANAVEDHMNDPRDRLAATIAAATEKSHAARGRQKSKLNATGLEKIWEDAFREAFPDDTYFRWRQYEQSAFKKAVERGVPRELLSEFIAFCVTSFDNVINEHFKWMKSRPTLPNVGFVTKHIAEFHQSFDDSRDPNRKVRARIRSAPEPKEPKRVRPAPQNNQEVASLRQEVSTLKARLGEAKGTRRRKLIRNRRREDDEFGRWED